MLRRFRAGGSPLNTVSPTAVYLRLVLRLLRVVLQHETRDDKGGKALLPSSEVPQASPSRAC